jgi:ferredoxin
MPYVVTDNCQKCRFTDCVSVCPVDAFHGDADMVYIEKDTCIDCGACEPQCPVHAIFPEDEVPAGKQSWIEINATRAPGLPVLTNKQQPLPTADARKKELGF